MRRLCPRHPETEDWMLSRTQAGIYLIDAVRSSRGMIFYSDLAPRIVAGGQQFGHWDRNFNALLGGVSEDSMRTYGCMLTAACVRMPIGDKLDNMPGKSFYLYAHTLGYEFPDTDLGWLEFWTHEYSRVLDIYRR